MILVDNHLAEKKKKTGNSEEPGNGSYSQNFLQGIPEEAMYYSVMIPMRTTIC